MSFYSSPGGCSPKTPLSLNSEPFFPVKLSLCVLENYEEIESKLAIPESFFSLKS